LFGSHLADVDFAEVAFRRFLDELGVLTPLVAGLDREDRAEQGHQQNAAEPQSRLHGILLWTKVNGSEAGNRGK
jgi:hypothetical protein